MGNCGRFFFYNNMYFITQKQKKKKTALRDMLRHFHPLYSYTLSYCKICQ